MSSLNNPPDQDQQIDSTQVKQPSLLDSNQQQLQGSQIQATAQPQPAQLPQKRPAPEQKEKAQRNPPRRSERPHKRLKRDNEEDFDPGKEFSRDEEEGEDDRSDVSNIEDDFEFKALQDLDKYHGPLSAGRSTSSKVSKKAQQYQRETLEKLFGSFTPIDDRNHLIEKNLELCRDKKTWNSVRNMKYSKVRENYKDYTVIEFLDEKSDELKVDDVIHVLLDKEYQIFDRGQETKLICNDFFHRYLSNMTRYSKITPDYNILKGLSD